MSVALQPASDHPGTWIRYRHNFSRHLLGVARYLQGSMMHRLQQEFGHGNLRLGFAPYITLIGEGDKRLTDLADILGISRQACNQAVKQIAAAGYVERSTDPADGRARRLTLSPRGRQLRADGVRVARELDDHFAGIVGDKAVAEAGRALARLCDGLALGPRGADAAEAGQAHMSGWLPRLSDYTMLRLMELTRTRGHPGLKLSFGQVLLFIGPGGGRIQQIADAQDLSKQAISVIATELEALGYLERHPDPNDARQILLQFTPFGEQLIADSVASVGELELEFAAVIGATATARLRKTLGDLYAGLELEQDVFESGAANLSLLAQQLLQQLGIRGSRALARLLLDPTGITR